MTPQQQIVRERRAEMAREHRATAKARTEHEAHANMLRALGRDVHEQGEFTISFSDWARLSERNHLLRLHVPRGAQLSRPIRGAGSFVLAWRRDRVEVSV